MKHKIYDRILYNSYIKLNTSFARMLEILGHGCPIGIDPITFEEIKYDRNCYLRSKEYTPLNISIDDYLYDSRKDYEKFLRTLDKDKYRNCGRYYYE